MNENDNAEDKMTMFLSKMELKKNRYIHPNWTFQILKTIYLGVSIFAIYLLVGNDNAYQKAM